MFVKPARAVGGQSQTSDGAWPLFCAWRRDTIAHAVLTPAALLSGRPALGLNP